MSYDHYKLFIILFGLTNTLAIFIELINGVFHVHWDSFVIILFEDIFVYSKIQEYNVRHIRIELLRLRVEKLYDKLLKCKLLIELIVFLGHVVSKEGIRAERPRFR